MDALLAATTADRGDLMRLIRAWANQAQLQWRLVAEAERVADSVGGAASVNQIRLGQRRWLEELERCLLQLNLGIRRLQGVR